jgi:hypothetical protein
MRRVLLVFGFIFAFYMALTPPGLCPCWLMFNPAKHHPHFNERAERPHDHEYLLEYFQSQTVAAVPMMLMPIALLITLQAASGLWRGLASEIVLASSWALDPLTPPPRFWLSN